MKYTSSDLNAVVSPYSQGSLRDTISEVQPTMFFGVPRYEGTYMTNACRVHIGWFLSFTGQLINVRQIWSFSICR